MPEWWETPGGTPPQDDYPHPPPSVPVVSAQELDYAESVSNFNPGSTGIHDIPGVSITFTLDEAGPVVLEFGGQIQRTSAGGAMLIVATPAGATITASTALLYTSGAPHNIPGSIRLTLEAGEHTFKLQGYGGPPVGSWLIIASAAAPCWLRAVSVDVA